MVMPYIKIFKFVLFLYFFVAILLLRIDVGFGRVFLNFTLLCLTFILVVFSGLKNKIPIVFGFTILYLIYLILYFLITKNNVHASVFVSFYSLFFLSVVLVFDSQSEIYLRFLYRIFYFFISVLFLLLMSGFEPEEVFSGSRNTISLVLVSLGSIFLIDRRIKFDGYLVLILYFMIFLVSVMSMGRAGIISSLVLFVGSILYSCNILTSKRLFIFILGLFLSAALLLAFYEEVYRLSYFDYLKAKGLADSYRKYMFFEYLSSLNITNLFFGIDLSSLPYIGSFNNNPHNSFLFLHSYFGLLFLCILFVVSLYFLRMLLIFDLCSIVVFLAVFSRLWTDSSSDISMLPFLFFSMMFMSLAFRKQRW